jgi:hypothetical protein
MQIKVGVISEDQMMGCLVGTLETLLELLLGENYLPYLEDKRD